VRGGVSVVTNKAAIGSQPPAGRKTELKGGCTFDGEAVKSAFALLLEKVTKLCVKGGTKTDKKEERIGENYKRYDRKRFG